MQDTLVHEMVHVYDHARFKVDWSDLRHHACSEVGLFLLLLLLAWYGIKCAGVRFERLV
jgi:hypothetical protein